MKRAIITVLIIAMLQMSFCAFAQNAPQLKRNGDEVLIEGAAGSVNELVTVKVYRENGELIYINQTKSNNMKGYSFGFTPNITETENLTIKVKCAGSENIATTTAPYEVTADIAPPDTDGEEGSGESTTPPGGGTVSSGGNSPISSGGGGGGGGGSSSANDKKEESPTEDKKEEEIKGEATSSLKDVENHWGKEDITFLYEKGIVTGDTEGNYNPDSRIKRSEFLALAVRAIGLEEAAYEGGFSDVNENDWYAKIVQSALNAQLISKDSAFRPEEEIKREEMAKIAASLIEVTDGDEAGAEFSDNADISDWAKPYVEKAVRIGLIKGDDKGFFNPHSGATKAESAAVIKRLYERLEVQ